jgi:hypothetical protein
MKRLVLSLVTVGACVFLGAFEESRAEIAEPLVFQCTFQACTIYTSTGRAPQCGPLVDADVSIDMNRMQANGFTHGEWRQATIASESVSWRDTSSLPTTIPGMRVDSAVDLGINRYSLKLIYQAQDVTKRGEQIVDRSSTLAFYQCRRVQKQF